MLPWRCFSLGPEHSPRPMGKRRSFQRLASAGAGAKKHPNAVTLSFIALAYISGIAFEGVLRNALPEQSLSGDAKDIVRLGTGLVGTVAALVLGLLAKSSHDTHSKQVRQMSVLACELGRLMRRTGLP